jgi:hypothetical protein
MRYLFRIISTLAVALAALSLSVAPAAAGNAHFVKASASASAPGLTVTFKEAGLESGSVETVVASADFVAVFQCINGGKKNPSAGNKTTISGSSSGSGQFGADRNGNINGSVTIDAPSVDNNGFECPNGQTEQLSQISWSNITLLDQTSGAFTTVPGTFSFGSVV